MKTAIRVSALSFVLGCAFTFDASATLVTKSFSGVVNSASPSASLAGTTLSGIFTYDTGATDLDVTSAVGVYGGSALTIEIQSISFSAVTMTGTLIIRNLVGVDELSLFAFSGPHQVTLQWTDLSASAFASDALPGDIDFSLFDNATFNVLLTDNMGLRQRLDGMINLPQLTEVPEPAPLLTLGGLLPLAAFLRRRRQ